MDTNPAGQTTGESRRATWILLAGLAILFTVGVFIVRDYGEGVDEWHNATYGWAFIHAYEAGNIFVNPGIRYFNGPLFMMLWVAVGQGLHWVNSGWAVVDGRHFTVFLTFLIGLWFFYRLCKRYVSPGIALTAVALFATQPLLFGHAFINQKDTPLMVFFLMSVTLGFEAVDRLQTPPDTGQRHRQPVSGWWGKGRWKQALVCLGAVGGLVFLLDLWIFGGLVRSAHALVEAAYRGQAWGWVDALFARVATDAYKTPVDLYLAKVDRAAIWLRLLATAIVIVLARVVAARTFPVWAETRLRPWERRWGLALSAGVAIGATTSIRLVGPLAGGLVGLLLLIRCPRGAWWPMAVIGVTAIATTYVTWPVLWGNPVGEFLSHAGEASGFTTNTVLFAGHRFESTNLPWNYLPWLLAIQLTLPAVALALFGVGIALWRLIRDFTRGLEVALILVWVALPVAAVVSGLVPIYNNFRHVLFIMPAVFVLVALGLEQAARLRISPLMRALGMACILAPGVFGILYLHPYEYTYYNALVGGMDGAAGRYEMDYWCTSFRRTMDYVDQVAPPGASVTVAGALTTAAPYARPDLVLTLDRSGQSRPDFGLACGPTVDFRDYLPTYKTVFSVNRGRAIYSLVKVP